MVGRLNTRQTWQAVLTVLVVLGFAVSAIAQGSNAMLEGVVRDAKGAAVAGATVNVRSTDVSTRTYSDKSGKDGRFLIIGISPGQYSISSELPSANMASAAQTMGLRAGQRSKVELVMADKAAVERAAAANTPEGKAEAAALAKMGKVFDEGVAASTAGNHDLAIAKFTESLTVNPSCATCYKNIGYSHIQKKDWAKAEEAYKKAIELSKTPDAEAYAALANVYSSQKKFEQAAEMNAKAAAAAPAGAGGGGDPESLYAQGVNLFNANKGAEAKAALQAAIKGNPKHADAHYLLGLVLVGEGDTKGALAAFQTYLQLAPNGQNAATAKAALDSLK